MVARSQRPSLDAPTAVPGGGDGATLDVLAGATLDALTAHLAILDARGTIRQVNDAWQRFARANAGDDASTGVGTNYLEVCEQATGPCADEAGAVAAGIREVLAGRRERFALEYPCHSDQERRWFIVRVTPVPAPGPRHVVVTHENITDRKTAELALHESEQRYALTIHGSQSAIWDWDLVENRIHYASSWARLLGCDVSELSDSPEQWLNRIAPEHRARLQAALDRHIAGESEVVDQQIKMQHADGSSVWVLCRAVAVRDPEGRAVRLAGSLADITELKRTQSKLEWLAMHDPLTRLANRKRFTERVRKAIERYAKDPSAEFAVFALDFDRFKLVNDTLGHDVGDALLQSIAQRFREACAEAICIARFGGDEFAMLMSPASAAHAERVAEQLVQTFARPYQVSGYELVSTASVGVVHSQMGHASVEDLLRDADAAMYQAKYQGKNGYRFFDARLQQRIALDLDLERRLWRDSYERDFHLVFQPILCLRGGALATFEVLARWEHPRQGMIDPERFIRIAEESGSIVPLGAWILDQACAQLARWRQRPQAGALGVNVNISKRQLVDPAFMERVRQSLSRHGLPAAALTLEVTESTVMSDQEQVVAMLAELRKLGVRLALDDFGTGNSSLSCLHEFPVDQLKIDRSFTSNMSTRREYAAVTNAVVALAQNLNMAVVAEGVESADQLVQLQAMDVAYGQGYHLAMPMNADEAGQWLASASCVDPAA